MILSLFRILSKSKEIEEMRKGVSEYVIRLEKANNRKEKQLKTEGNIKGVKLEGKPADRIEEKPEDKSE